MAGYKRAEVNALRQRMIKTSGFDYENLCFEVFKTVYPDLVNAKALGVMDRLGKDLYVLAEGEEVIPIAIQCKGFELPTFEEAQLTQCLKSIATLRKKGLKVSKYILSVNRQIRDGELRERLSIELGKLIEDSFVEQAVLFEPQSCVKFVFDHHMTALRKIVERRNSEFREDYAQRMGQDFYLEAVPFEDEKYRYHNPVKFISGSRIRSADSDGSRRVWTFVQSEFGFGKTSLLLQLPQKVEDVNFIYIPLAQMEAGTFTNEMSLVRGILSMLLNRELVMGAETHSQIAERFLESALSTILRSERKLVLLYDGLDEHQEAYSEKGLKAIFNCAAGFVCSSIFSMRKEFVDERRGNFDRALEDLKQNAPEIESIQLVNWGTNQIVSYLESQIEWAIGEGAKKNLTELLKVVAQGRYEDYFGDIPKRPLFLNMLSQDAQVGGVKKVKLSSLYQTYLGNKFCLDEQTSVSKPKDGRPISLGGDHYAKLGTIFSILTDISGQMCSVKNGQLSLAQSIDEAQIKDCIANHTNKLNDIVELMLSSVLVPFSERSINGFSAKFAHKSFQEYFTALYLHKSFWATQSTFSDPHTIRIDASMDSWLFADCTAGVMRFFKELCSDDGRYILNFYVSPGDNPSSTHICDPSKLTGLASILHRNEYIVG